MVGLFKTVWSGVGENCCGLVVFVVGVSLFSSFWMEFGVMVVSCCGGKIKTVVGMVIVERK